MPRRAPSSFAQDRAEVATFDKPCRRASLYLAPMTPRAITGKIARLITTAWPASPKKDADARNKRGHRERAEFHLSRISRPRERSMAKVVFTPNIQRHVALPEAEASGRTVRDVLEAVFADNPQARGYVLDDQSGLRKHMAIFVDGRMIRDRARLTDAVSESSTVYVFQALSGG
jgi:molybdopterin synthase sulfur carrier subunit